MTEMTGRTMVGISNKRITCPVCKGMSADVSVWGLDSDPCPACNNEGEVCVCPVCEGSRERQGAPCDVCESKGWVRVSDWDKAVDEGHKRLMEEHKKDEQAKVQDEQTDIANLVVLHRMAMNALMAEWEKLCKKHEAHTVDAGVFGRILGGMTVAFFTTMEEELGINKHQVFARFVNGMLHYMETRDDSKGVGIVVGQSAECREGMQAMAAVKGDKEMMN